MQVRTFGVILFALLIFGPAADKVAANTLDGRSDFGLQIAGLNAKIDPGVELITIMLWLSGKYPMPMDSKYKSEVWSTFSRFSQHPSLDRMKNTDLYPDFTEVGLLLSSFPDVKVEVPEKNSWYEKKGGKDNIVGIL